MVENAGNSPKTAKSDSQFKAALKPIKQDFIDYDFPATVVEDLEAAIVEFDEATGRRYAGLGKQVEATASLKIIARNGVIVVRALTAIMIKRYRDEPGLLAEWMAAQRIFGWPTPATVEEIASGDGSGSGGEGGSTTPPSGS